MVRIDVSRAEVKKMGWQRKAWNCISGGKSICSSATGDFARPRTRPGLAVALALVLATLVLSIVIPYARAADPGHPASSISAGTFESGDYTFPSNLTVSKFFIVNTSTLYVDALNERVGIKEMAPSYLLQVANASNAMNVSNVLFVNGTSGRVGIMTVSPTTTLYVTGNTYTSSTLSSGSDIYTTGTGDDLWLGNSTQASSKMQLYASGRLNVLSGNLTVNETTGYVGIGTTSPDTALSFGSSSTIDTLTGNLTIQVPSGSRILVGTGDLGDAVGKRFGFGDSNPTAVFEIADGYNDNLDTFYVKSRANDANQKVAYLFGEATNFQGYLLYMDTNEESGSTWNYMKGLADADGTPVQQFLLTGEGKLILGSGNPTNKLTVVGDVNATTNISTPKLCLNGDCQTSWPAGGAGWAASGNYVYNDTAAAKVGIGTATPQQKLDVIGTVNATDYLCTGGSDCIGATEINATDLASECSSITGSAGLCDSVDNTCSTSACTVGSDDTLTNPTVGGALSMANYAISNIGNANTDFTSDGGLTLNGNFSVLGTGTHTIAGNTSFDGGTLYVDSNNDRVGIGTTTPTVLLDAVGTASAVLIRVKTTNADTDSAISITNDAKTWLLQTRGYDLADAFVIRESGVGDRLTILSGGNVGIGTTSPSKKLEVSNSTQGITFDPTVINPVINTTANNLTITSAGGNVIIQLG